MARMKKVMMPKGARSEKIELSRGRGSAFPRIPEVVVKSIEEVEVYRVHDPFAYSRIIYDHDRSEYVYEVWEPQLAEKERKLLDMLKDALTRTLEYEGEKMAPKDKEEYLKEAVESFIKSRGLRLEPSSRDKVVYYIIRDFVGYGPIHALIPHHRIEE